MYHDVQNVQGKLIHKKSYLISKNDHYEAIAYLELEVLHPRMEVPLPRAI